MWGREESEKFSLSWYALLHLTFFGEIILKPLYYTARNIMMSFFRCLSAQSAIWLRQSYGSDFSSSFEQVALFSDFNPLFELPGRGFVPYSSNAFYILE